VEFEQQEPRRQTLVLRRRKLMSWNKGRRFRLAAPPPVPAASASLSGPAAAVATIEALPTMPWAGQIQKLKLSNSNVEAGGYTLSVDGIVLECCAAAFERSDGCDVRATAIRTVPELADSDIANAASVSGSVAVITRGGCTYVDKARRAMAAGAAAVVIVNTDE